MVFNFFILFQLLQTYSQLTVPLREAATNRGIFIGASLRIQDLQNNDEQYNKVAGEQYDLTTPGNACKWQATEPHYNVFNFTECDYMHNFAVSKNMTFRGHNLCWGNSNPSWLLNGNYTPSQLQTILQTHITTVVEHYPGKKIYCWDVVNEAVSDNPSKNGLYKNNIWYPAIPNYVDLAFQYTKSANSQVKLFYNDYNILLSTGWMQQKSDAVYNMTKTMIKNGIPIDGIGFQAHLNMDDYNYVINGYQNILSNFKRFADLGLEIHITEMDIECGQRASNGTTIPCQSFTKQIETQQAQMYQTVLNACLNVPNCKNFETWGYTDRYTWRGSNEYPLPWDCNYNPKTAAYYIENALLNKTNS